MNERQDTLILHLSTPGIQFEVLLDIYDQQDERIWLTPQQAKRMRISLQMFELAVEANEEIL